MLNEITPAGVNAIFERFRSILQEGEVNKRCQYVIEKLFRVRKEKFAKHPGVIPELDLVEEDDRITHEISLDDEDLGTKENTMDQCNLFQFDPNYTKTEAEWDEIKKEILGETEAVRVNGQAGMVREGDDENASDRDASEEDEHED